MGWRATEGADEGRGALVTRRAARVGPAKACVMGRCLSLFPHRTCWLSDYCLHRHTFAEELAEELLRPGGCCCGCDNGWGCAGEDIHFIPFHKGCITIRNSQCSLSAFENYYPHYKRFWWASCQLYVLHNCLLNSGRHRSLSTDDAIQDVRSDPLGY